MTTATTTAPVQSTATPASAPAAAPTTPAAAPAATSAASASSSQMAATSDSASASAPATAHVPDWLTGLNDQVKGYATNKGWKSPAEVLDSYQNLEKLVGAPQDKIIKLPGDDDKDGWNSVYSRLGRPQTPEEYKLDVPKEGGDPEFAKWAAGNFHELGLSAKQGQTLAAKFNEYAAGMKAAQDAALIQKLDQGQVTMKKEWGAAFEQNVKVASKAAREFGVSPEVIDKIENAIGYDGVMKLFHSIGSKIGESSFVQGNVAGGALTPDQAKAKISALQQDNGWVKKYTAGDLGAREEMSRLHQMAYQGDMTL
jgi:hypothetical protein